MVKFIILRHTNKPHPNPVTGVRSENASKEGYLRAEMIVSFFEKKVLKDGKIVALYASNPYHSITGELCSDHSKREIELLQPTSEYFGIPIETPYCVSEYEDLAHLLLQKYPNGGKDTMEDIVVVAWEHQHIPLLLNALNVKPNVPMWPASASNRFDLVFTVTAFGGFDTASGRKSTMTISTEELGLPGDSLSIPDVYTQYLPLELYEKSSYNKTMPSSYNVLGGSKGAYYWPYYGDGYPLYEDDPDYMKNRSIHPSLARMSLDSVSGETSSKMYRILALVLFVILMIFLTKK